MKKILSTIIIALFLTTTTFGTAFAAAADSTASTAGITPDSILYPIDKLLEKIQLFLTTNDIDKAKLLVENAEERLAEAQVMLDAGKTTLVESAANDYTDTIEQSNDILEGVADQQNQDGASTQDQATSTDGTTPSDGTAVSDQQSGDNGTAAVDNSQNQDQSEATDGSRQNKTSSVLDELLNKNIELQKKSVDVLAGLLDKLPEQSREAIMAVIVKQIMRAEAVRDFVDTKKAYNEGRKDVKEAEKKLKEAQKSGDQSSIDEAKLSLEEANKKLEELASTKDEASSIKKNIKTLIDEKLAEINKPADTTTTTGSENAEKDSAVQQGGTAQTANALKDQVDKIKNEIKEQNREKTHQEEKEKSIF